MNVDDKIILPDSQEAATYRTDIAANAEIERLQEALFFWLPGVPAIDSECADRIAHEEFRAQINAMNARGVPE